MMVGLSFLMEFVYSSSAACPGFLRLALVQGVEAGQEGNLQSGFILFSVMGLMNLGHLDTPSFI